MNLMLSRKREDEPLGKRVLFGRIAIMLFLLSGCSDQYKSSIDSWNDNLGRNSDEFAIRVTPSPVLLKSSGLKGGPFNPASIQTSILNTRVKTLNWKITIDVPWIFVSKMSGTLGAYKSETITVSIINEKAGLLEPGVYRGTLRFFDDVKNRTTLRFVDLTVSEQKCGNNIVDSDEECDGTDLAGESCETFGFSGGTLRCLADCSDFDVSLCFSGECKSATPVWQNFSHSPLQGIVEARFSAKPAASFMDGLIALSSAAGSTYSDYAVMVRFNQSGSIDARNGSAFSADIPLPYSAGSIYEFRLLVDLASRKYDVFVKSTGGTELQIANDYDFRTEQSMTDRIANYGIIADLGLEVCDFSATVIGLCGDNIAQEGEICDGMDLKGETCQSQGFPNGGTLKCNSTCSAFDVSSCSTGGGSCHDSTAGWQNYVLPTMEGIIEARFGATPLASNMDGIVALSQVAGSAFSDYAVMVRFNAEGKVDARNGSEYAADVALSYQANSRYDFRIVLDTGLHTFDLFVAPAGGGEIQVASKYAFRSEQIGTSLISNYGIFADIGSMRVCDFSAKVISNPLRADVGPDLAIAKGGAVQIMATVTGGVKPYQFSWSPTAGLSSATALQPIATPTATTTYKLRVTDGESKVAEDYVVITVSTVTGPQVIPIGRWDMTPFQRINAGEILNLGVVAFSKNGIAKVEYRIIGSGYTGPNPLIATAMTFNPQSKVYEYNVGLKAGDFSVDGIFKIEATIRGLDEGVRDKTTGGKDLGLNPLTVVVNAHGTQPAFEAFVSLSGKDDMGVVGDSGKPFATIGGAIVAIRNRRNQLGLGYNVDGGIVRLMKGSYSNTTGGVTGKIAADNEWLTITTVDGSRDGTILSGGTMVGVQKIRLKGLTIPYPGPLGGLSYNDRLLMQVWVDDCSLNGASDTWYHPLPVEWQKLYFTDSYITHVRQATSGASLCRGMTIQTICDDAFQNIPIVVNAVVDDINPRDTNAHADAWQHGGGYDDDNVILYNMRATNIKYPYSQSIFIRGDTYSPPFKAQGMAFVNVYTEMTENSGWGGWYRWVDHLIWWNLTFRGKGMGIMRDTYAGEFRDCEISNFSAKGNDFAFFGVGGGEAGIDYSGWDYNHFVDGSATRGNHVSTGPNKLDSFGIPLADSPLLDKLFPLLVPADANNRLRTNGGEIGAYER